MDRFVESMTFAHFGACDCDECEVPMRGSNNNIPTSIQEALQSHKRQRLLNDTIAATITQKRTLVSRASNQVSIWKLLLPPGSEPLTEFGGSHRIVVVDSKPKERVVKMIGEGIIGSKDEESSRKDQHWEETSAYLYRSNGGKAIGWINEKMESDQGRNVSDVTADVVAYVIKAPKDALDSHDTILHSHDENLRDLNWEDKVLHIFYKSLEMGRPKTSMEDSNVEVTTPADAKMRSHYTIPTEDVETLKDIVSSLIDI